MAVIITHLTGGWAGQRQVLDKEAITFGRAADNDVVFHPRDVRASAHHAALFVQGGECLLEDLNSTNGIYVNGVKVRRAHLRSGDLVEFGRKGPRLRIEVGLDVEGQSGARLLHDQEEGAATSSVSSFIQTEAREASSSRLGRTTVQMMIDAALRRSSWRFRWWAMGLSLVTLGVLAAATYTVLVRDRPSDSSSTENDSSFSAVAERNQAAVVLIRNSFILTDPITTQTTTAVSEGSGFAVDPSGLVVTNYHIIRPWEVDPKMMSQRVQGRTTSLTVIFADRTPEDALEARLLRGSKETDLAVLQIVSDRPVPVVSGFEPDTAQARQGDEVAIIGFPLGTTLLQTTGQQRATTTLTRSTISKSTPTIIQLDAPVFQGFSGSPIFNRQGKVIGVLTARLGELGEPLDPSARSIGLATPIRFVRDLLEEVK
jgi:S1-C subfamily serine protease